MPKAVPSVIWLAYLHHYSNTRLGDQLAAMTGHSKTKMKKNLGEADDGGTSKRNRFCTICGQPGRKSTTCLDRGDMPKKLRKEPACTNCDVGGHQRNTYRQQS